MLTNMAVKTNMANQLIAMILLCPKLGLVRLLDVYMYILYVTVVFMIFPLKGEGLLLKNYIII